MYTYASNKTFIYTMPFYYVILLCHFYYMLYRSSPDYTPVYPVYGTPIPLLGTGDNQ